MFIFLAIFRQCFQVARQLQGNACTIGVQGAQREAMAASNFPLNLSHEGRTIAAQTTCDSLAFVSTLRLPCDNRETL